MRTLVAWTISALIVVWWGGASPSFCQQDEPGPQERAPVAVAPERNKDPDLESGMTDIHDIKSLENFPGFPFYAKAFLAISALLLVMLSIYLAIRFYMKRKKKTNRSPPALSPEEAAFKALVEIRDLMDIDGKLFYFRLSLALREYIEGKFSVNAAEMTTEELFPILKTLRLDKELESETRRFFDYSDPVKFAGAVPERVKMERHLKFVRYFIKMTAEDSNEHNDFPAEAKIASGNELAARTSESG